MSQTYPFRYQAAAKKLDQRLTQLGAQKVTERGEGDGKLRSLYQDAKASNFVENIQIESMQRDDTNCV